MDIGMSPEYFLKYSMEVLNEKNDSHLDHFEKLSDILVSLFIIRINRKTSNFNSERLYFINLITQKFLLHTSSIKKLINGVEIESKNSGIQISLSDPFSIYALERTLIESYLVQNYLSNRSENKDILDGRFDIWMRYGLKQRGIEPETDEEIQTSKSDMDSIEILENKIKNREFFKRLSSDKQLTFLREINKGWKFTFKEDKFHPVSWKELIKLSGVKDSINENIYNILSWHAHSQSISILQLKNMWDDDFDQVSIKTSINKVNMFISFMISDIVYSDIEFKKVFKSLDEEMRELVNFFNLSYRSDKFTVK